MNVEESSIPASVHAEVAILGACLLYPDAVNDATELLEVDDFFLESHRRVYSCIFDLSESGETADNITVEAELRKRRQLDSIGGLGYFLFLTEGIPRNFNVVSYARIVKDKAILRSVMAISEIAKARAMDQSESGSSILGDMEESILELTQSYSQQAFGTILDAVKEVGTIDEFVSKMCDPLEMTGLATGYTEFDAMTGGLQPSELVILAARPSMGKSALMLNIATNVVLADIKKVVAIFSLEMSKDSLYRRMLASLANVSARRAQAGHISAEERRRISGALLAIADKHLMIDETASITSTQVRAKCRRLKQTMGRLDLVMIDYLQMMQGSKKYGNREQEVAGISRSLKALAKELEVPVVALAMVGRGSEKHGDNRPKLSDLRESGSIEADADIVAFIHRESYYRPDDEEVRGLADITIAKARNGPTGKVDLAYSADATRFDNLHRQ